MATFSAFLPLLQQVEGGYTNNPNDNGNWTGGKKGVGNLVGTNYGISAPVYAQWIGHDPTAQEMKGITKSIAQQIFKDWYWNKVNADAIKDQSVANIIVDHAVNAGSGSAGKIVQRVLNESFGYSLAVDGAIGTATIKAINAVDPYKLHEAIKLKRKRFYEDLGQDTFTKGWLIRLSKFVYKKKAAIGIGVVVLALTAVIIIKTVKKDGRTPKK